MSLPYVRQRYGVPAKRGGRVRFRGAVWRITSANNHLRVRLVEGARIGHRVRLHPTEEGLEYLDDEGRVVWPESKGVSDE